MAFSLASPVVLGYGLSLYIVSSVTENEKLGFALGLVTASYAFGAVIFSMLYPFLFDHFGFKMDILCGLLILSSIVFYWSSLVFNFKSEVNTRIINSQQKDFNEVKILKLWLGYFLGVFAGLMIIGHAVPMISSFGGSTSTSITAITSNDSWKWYCRYLCRLVVDRFGCKRPLLTILLINSLALYGSFNNDKY